EENSMPRPFHTFIGIDLGGARGKTTAVARLTVAPEGSPGPGHSGPGGDAGVALVEEVSTRRGSRAPWCDRELVAYLAELPEGVVVAIDAPLTLPACVRCVEPVCPGQEACEVPAVMWLKTRGVELVQ